MTFALGQEAQDQVDRLARVLSMYRKGGVSQSAVVRGLVQLAESVALQSGDPAVKPVFGSAIPVPGKPDPEATRMWEKIRAQITSE